MASDVFFMSDRASNDRESLIFKAVQLFRDAGLNSLFKPGDTVGVKLHLGEHGATANLRPQYIRVIVDEITRSGGKPVLLDCGTHANKESGARIGAREHLWVAARHGFTEETMGCPLWIADGELGLDDVKVEVPHGVYLKHSFMGKRFLELDAMIVVSHFKGHTMGVFGGALKNVGIGCGSKRGKATTHLMNDPVYGLKNCEINQEAAARAAEEGTPNRVERLLKRCPFDCLSYENGVFRINQDECRLCGVCFLVGQNTGIFKPNPGIYAMWAATIPDACAAYLNAIGPEKVGYLSYAVDITPVCDCSNFTDRPLVPNLGVFASKDPVAIDSACLEMEEAVNVVPGSKADDFGFDEPGCERFTNCSSMTKVSQWTQINAAIYNGIGTSEYRLIISNPPASTVEFWPPPYNPGYTWPMAHRKALREFDWDAGDAFLGGLRTSVAELARKPKGKVDEVEIAELAEVKGQS